MPSFEDIASRDQRHHKTLHLQTPGGMKFAVEVDFFINRVTLEYVEIDVADYLEPGEEVDDLTDAEIEAIRVAVGFCDQVADWDMTGPLKNRAGRNVVEANDPVPLDPRIVRYAPLWLLNGITRAMLDLLNPNRSSSRFSRKR